MRYVLLLFTILYLIKELDADNGCNRPGFSGPSCQFLDCGSHGVLNRNGTACLCDSGFKGIRCEECATVIREPLANREYLCCPFLTSESVAEEDLQWWLVAPKIKHSMKFLSGAFTSVNCLRPGSSFYQNETSEYFLDCNCKLYISGEKRKRRFDQAEDDSASSLLQNKRDVRSTLDAFWQNEIEKRDQKQKHLLSPSILADILMSEYTNNEAKIRSSLLSSQKKNSTAHFTAAASSSSSCEGETWVIVLCSIFIAIIVVVVVSACWCFVNHRRAFYNVWYSLNADPKTLENVVVKNEEIASSIKRSKKDRNDSKKFKF